MQPVYEQMQAPDAQFVVKRAYILGCSTPTDSMLASHAHDCLEIIHVNSDQCRFVLQDKAFRLRREDLVLYRSALPHRVEWLAQTSRPLYGITIECLSFGGPGLSCAQIMRASPSLREFFAAFEDLVILHDAGGTARGLHGLTSELLSENDPGYETILLNRLLIDIAQMSITKSGAAARYVEKVCRYIAEHYQTIRGVEEIAAMLGLTKNHVQRLFKSQMGQSLWQYVIDVRLQHARKLLAEEELSIEEIGARIGIHSRQNFNLLFRRAHGTSPQAFRKALRPL